MPAVPSSDVTVGATGRRVIADDARRPAHAMRARARLIAALATLSLAACPPAKDAPAATDTVASSTAAPADAGAMRRFLDSVNVGYAAALERGDTMAVAAHFADDAIVMLPGQAAFRGRDAYRSGLAGWLSETTVKDATFSTEDVLVGGELAVETGKYELTLQPRRGRAIRDRGKYLTVWRRQPDGSWKIARDINNPDPPA